MVLASEVLTTVKLVVDAVILVVDDEVVLAPVDDVVIGFLLGLFEGDRLGALVGCEIT